MLESVRYGRTGVYDLQRLLQLVLGEGRDRREEVGLAREVMAQLPRYTLIKT